MNIVGSVRFRIFLFQFRIDRDYRVSENYASIGNVNVTSALGPGIFLRPMSYHFRFALSHAQTRFLFRPTLSLFAYDHVQTAFNR